MTEHKMTDAELAELKRRVSAAVLKSVEGVAGVGLHAQRITIYLEQDTPEIRDAVTEAVRPLALAVPLQWRVTGKFER